MSNQLKLAISKAKDQITAAMWEAHLSEIPLTHLDENLREIKR